MRVLILGDADSDLIRQYVDNVLIKQGAQVVIASENYKGRFKDFYEEKGVTVVCLASIKRIPLIDRIPKLCGFVRIVQAQLALKRLAPYDVVHIHFVNKTKLRIADALKNGKSRVVVSFWGSDILRRNRRELYSLRRFLERADCITVVVQSMQDRFREVFGDRFDSKLFRTVFGGDCLDIISELQKTVTKEECKRHFGLDSERITVAVGYNRIPEQQHDSMLEQISELPQRYLDRIQVVLPFAYGAESDDYTKKLECIISAMRCPVYIKRDFLFSQELAKFRLAADIYVNAQTTDAFCMSMREYICSGAAVINAAWLKYEDLEKNEIKYMSFDTFDALPEILKKVIDNGFDTAGNTEKMLEISSWSSARETWNLCYESVK